MAVGKGSMERAAKAAAPAKTTEKKQTAVDAKTVEKKPEREAVKAEVKKPSEIQTKAETKRKPRTKAQEQIVYQKSSGMLERAAEPNELFGLGDEMPVYYF